MADGDNLWTTTLTNAFLCRRWFGALNDIVFLEEFMKDTEASYQKGNSGGVMSSTLLSIAMPSWTHYDKMLNLYCDFTETV